MINEANLSPRVYGHDQKVSPDQSGGAVKVWWREGSGEGRKWQKEDEDGEAAGSVSRFSTLTKRDTETWRPKEGW